MNDPLRHHKTARAKHANTEKVIGDSFMEGVAEKTASIMGTPGFVIAGIVVIAGWVLINNAIPYVEETVKHLAQGKPFDPVPWILLNLVFSGVAFFTGSLVIIAQKAEAKKNNAREEAEATHREEVAASQQKMLEENTRLTQAVHKLSEELHATVCKPAPVKPKRSGRAVE